MRSFVALIAGLFFGLGLIGSGMGDPAKVQNFLDIFGYWDPSLVLVMGGAIAVGMIAFSWAKARGKTLLGQQIAWPSSTHIDRQLLIGASLFGVGWGLAGFCPAPAIMNVITGQPMVWLFVISMLVGMLAQHVWQGQKK